MLSTPIRTPIDAPIVAPICTPRCAPIHTPVYAQIYTPIYTPMIWITKGGRPSAAHPSVVNKIGVYIGVYICV